MNDATAACTIREPAGVRRRLQVQIDHLTKLRARHRSASTRWAESKPQEAEYNRLVADGLDKAIGALQNYVDQRFGDIEDNRPPRPTAAHVAAHRASWKRRKAKNDSHEAVPGDF